jgi:hypothetical protein
MTRGRSEYRLAPISIDGAPAGPDVSEPVEGDRGALAELLLAADRGTVDDEGADVEDARSALDRYFEILIRPHSLVVRDGGIPVAFSFVVVAGGLHHIDPVVVAPHRKRAGVGSDVVRRSLRSLASAASTRSVRRSPPATRRPRRSSAVPGASATDPAAAALTRRTKRRTLVA